jgi:hypothetical protein
LTIDLAARIAAVVGLQLSVSLHPDGDPLRDEGHVTLIRRFLDRMGESIDVRLEVPIPIPGDRRGADIGLTSPAGLDAMVAAETHLDDVQALLRSMAAKQRDLGVNRGSCSSPTPSRTSRPGRCAKVPPGWSSCERPLIL